MTNPETGYEKAHRQAEQIFREVFSARGMSVREGQIRLCHAMLDTLFGRNVALCDAGVGLGKTYAMAQMLNQRGLRTRQGAEFQSSNIKRMIQHEGYTGYIITKAARSEFIPQLQIIDEDLFAKANEMISKRSKKLQIPLVQSLRASAKTASRAIRNEFNRA